MKNRIIYPLLSVAMLASSFFIQKKEITTNAVDENLCSIVGGHAGIMSEISTWLGLQVADKNGEMIYSLSDTYAGACLDSTGKSILPTQFTLKNAAISETYDFFIRQNFVFCSHGNDGRGSYIGGAGYVNTITINVSRAFLTGEVIKIAKDSKFPDAQYLKTKGASGKMYTLDDDYYIMMNSEKNFTVVDKVFGEAKDNASRNLWDYSASNEYREADRISMKQCAKDFLSDLLQTTAYSEVDSVMNDFNKEISKFKTNSELIVIENTRSEILNNINSYFEFETSAYSTEINNYASLLINTLKVDLSNCIDLEYINACIDSLKIALESFTKNSDLSELTTIKTEYCVLLDGFNNNNPAVSEIIKKGKKEINESINKNSAFGAYITARNELLKYC